MNAVVLPIELQFDLPKLNAQIAALGKSMGPLGQGFKPLDEKLFTAPLKAASDQAKATASNIDLIAQEADKAARSGGDAFTKAFKFSVVQEGVDKALTGIRALAQPFTELDTATAQLKTLGAEAAAMAPSLRSAAIEMSKDLPFSAAEIQTTMFDALASGVKGGEEGLKAFADTAARLATGGGSSIGDATKLLAGQLNAYGKSADDAAKFSDIFFNTVNYGVTSIPELTNSLSNVIPTAASLGIEIENVGGALALMTSKGIPTAQSTTKLNQLLLELAKPGAALVPILEKAGVSLDSLKKDDLPVTLKKVNDALKETGVSALSVFSSSEAGAAFNTLAGDLDGFAQTFADVRDTTGSAQFAYEQMAGSIETQTKQMLSSAQAFVIQGLDGLGSGVVGLASKAGALAPMVSTLAGFSQILPKGTADKFLDVGKAIIGKVVPSLVAQVGATGAATTAQFSLNAAIAANPIGATIVLIAGLVAATKLLADAINETAGERLEEQKASTAILEEQRKVTQARYDAIAAQGQQVASYRASIASQAALKAASQDETKTDAERQQAKDNLAASQERLLDRTVALTGAFPSAVSAGKSFEDNLRAMEGEASKSVDSLIKVAGELNTLDKQLAKARAIELNIETQIAAEEIENQLSDAIKSIDPLADAIGESLFGTSQARKQGEKFISGFKSEVFGAKTSEQLAIAQSKMISEIALKGESLGIDKKEQAALIKSVRAAGEARKKELEAIAENDKSLNKTTADSIAKTLSDATAAGGKTSESITKIATAFGVTEQKVRSVSFTKELEDATAKGAVTETQIAAIATKYGVSTEEAKKLVAEQKKQTAEAAQTAAGVQDIGKAFTEAGKAASEGFAKGKADLAALLAERKKYGSMTPEEKKANEDRIAATIQGNRVLKGQLDDNAKLIKQSAELSGEVEKKKTKTSRDVEDEITRIRRESQTIRAELDRKANSDDTERRRAELVAKQADETRAVQDDIAKAKKSADLSADAKIKIDAALNEKLASVQARQQQQLADFEATLLRERLEKERQVREQEEARKVALETDLRKLGIESLEVLEVRAGEDEVSRLRDLAKLRQDELKAQHAAEVKTFVERNGDVVKAQEALATALATGRPELIDDAQANVALARARAIAEDPLVIAAYGRQARQIADLQKAEDEKLQRARIAQITDLEAQKRDVGMLEAQKTYDAALAAAKGNNALELEARRAFLATKASLELGYLRATNAATDATLSIQAKLTAAFGELYGEEKRKVAKQDEKEHQEKVKRYGEEKRALGEQLESHVILFEEYQKSLEDLDKERIKDEEARQKKADERAQEKRDAIAKAFQTTADEQAKIYESLVAKGEAGYDRLAASATLSFAAQLAAGQSFQSAFLGMLLDLIGKSITAYIPQITAASIGMLGPIAGPIAAGVAIAGIQLALGSAKASLGARYGVVGFDKGYSMRPHRDDVVPVMLAYGETVMSKENTDRNRPALEYVQRTNKTFESYFESRSTQRTSEDLSRKFDAVIEALNKSERRKQPPTTITNKHQFKPMVLRGDTAVALYENTVQHKNSLVG